MSYYTCKYHYQSDKVNREIISLRCFVDFVMTVSSFKITRYTEP